jgi:hypothetical protein
MAFTVQDVIDDTRPLLSDTEVVYRWSDDQILVVLNEGLQQLFEDRPDSQLTLQVGPPDALTSLSAEVPVRPTFKGALRYFIAGSLIAERSSDKSLLNQSNAFIQRYASIASK